MIFKRTRARSSVQSDMNIFSKIIVLAKSKPRVVVFVAVVVICMVNFHFVLEVDKGCDLSGYKYSNVSRIVMELKKYNRTSTPQVNGIFEEFSILHTPKFPCQVKTKMLVIVKSAVFNMARRNIIRKTWANTQRFGINTYFMLGYNAPLDEYIRKEVAEHGDIVQGSFIDVYRNLTYKLCMTYRWVHQHCPGSPFVLLVDDDQFVNTDYIQSFIDSPSITNSVGKMYGAITRLWHPVRTEEDSKGFVSHKDYPPSCYPDYPYGGAIITTSDVIRDISLAIPYVVAFPIDDAYLGVVLNLLRIELVHDDRVTADNKPLDQLGKYFCVHRFREETLLIAWDQKQK